MNGNWLTKTKKAYVYRDIPYVRRSQNGSYQTNPGPAPAGANWDLGWRLTLLHGQSDYESFWYPTWDLAIQAIPDLWRH